MIVTISRGLRAVLLAAFLACAQVHSQTGPQKKFTIVAFGDSITAARTGVITYSDVLREELRDKGVEVINAGVPGNTTEHAKKRFDKDVIAQDPDLVIIQFGNNDAAVDVWKDPPATGPRVPLEQYLNNLSEMITALKSESARVILVTPLPTRWTEKLKGMYGKPPYDPADPDGFNYLKKEYVAGLRKLATKHKVPLIDLYSEYYRFADKSGRAMDELFVDGMHPNSEGHRIEAELLLKEFRKMKLDI